MTTGSDLIPVNSIILLINGIHFPFNLFEDALVWAKDHFCIFRSLILTDHLIVDSILEDSAGNPVSEQQRITEYINIMEDRTAALGLEYKNTIIVKPTIQMVLNEIRAAEKVFIGLQDDINFKDLSFKWSDMINLIPMRQQVISNRAYR
jgi:hypothetical protein